MYMVAVTIYETVKNRFAGQVTEIVHAPPPTEVVAPTVTSKCKTDMC